MENARYKTGYVLLDAESCVSVNSYGILKEAKSYCERLIVGLPNDDLVGRMRNVSTHSDFSLLKEMFAFLSFVSEVIEVDWNNISKLDMWEQIHYDVCFVGNVYGAQFYEDKKLLRARGAELLLINYKHKGINDEEALREAVKDAAYTKKIILFGTGAYFNLYMDTVGKT